MHISIPTFRNVRPLAELGSEVLLYGGAVQAGGVGVLGVVLLVPAQLGSVRLLVDVGVAG